MSNDKGKRVAEAVVNAGIGEPKDGVYPVGNLTTTDDHVKQLTSP